MRLVATEYLSLDGVFEEPGQWSGPFFGEEAAQFKWRELQASDALLLGRRTYEGFAAAWPTMPDTGAFGERMNGITKYVVSSTLGEPAWSGSELISGDVVGEIDKLKQRPGADLLLEGSAQLFNALMAADAIDVYRFMIHPVILGTGRRLLGEGRGRRALRLIESTRFETGIVVLEYASTTP